jgi:hypothetical protein
VTDRPYTDDDLIAEAARQHHDLTQDPDFMGIGEAMETIASTGESWEDALVTRDADDEDGDVGDWDAFDAAKRAIHDLINDAADVSGWAVRLGADGLEPRASALDLGPSSEPAQVRIHFAFDPDMSEQDRADLIAQIAAFTIHGLT